MKNRNGKDQPKPLREEVVDSIMTDIMGTHELKRAWDSLHPKVKNRLRVKWLNTVQRTIDLIGMFG